jgi:ferredoxin-thioredoxin reductase catalytic subunit
MKIRMNDDREAAQVVLDAISDNDGYCPCKIEKNEDTKCMCKEFRDQKESGMCHCGLYYKEV